MPKAIKIDLYCEVLNINNDLGVFSIPRQASGTKNTWVIIYTLATDTPKLRVKANLQEITVLSYALGYWNVFV